MIMAYNSLKNFQHDIWIEYDLIEILNETIII